MTRGLAPAEIAAAQAPYRIIVWLVEIQFISGTLRLALGPWDIAVGADTYARTGSLLSIKSIREAEGTTEGVQIILSGIDPAVIALAATEHVFGRPVRILKGFLDPETYALIAPPKPRWPGRVKSMPITETDKGCQITLFAEHFEADLEVPNPIRLNDQEYRRRHPGDRGAEYTEQMIEKTIIWPSREAMKAADEKRNG